MIRAPRLIPVLLLCVTAAWATPTLVGAQDGPTVVFLVRHAEKADEPAADPPLTATGRDRTDALATLLDDAELDAVWSTDYDRTRSTATPVARAQGLEVALYDPRDLERFAATLRERGGRALVVGHSNTTPALVGFLGGEPGPPIDEATEYDRLYVVTLAGGEVVTTLLRFGSHHRGG